MSVQEKRVFTGNEHTDMVNEPTNEQIWHGDHDAPYAERLAQRSGMVTGHLKWMRYDVKQCISFLRSLEGIPGAQYAGAKAQVVADDLQRIYDATAYVDIHSRIYETRERDK